MRDFATTFVDKQSLTLHLWFEPTEMEVYTHLEVWRSTLTAAGPYTEMTGSTAACATLLCPAIAGPLVGKSLHLHVNEVDLTLTFTGTDPLTPTEVAAQITALGAGLVVGVVDGAGALLLQSAGVGCGTRLRIIGGDATTSLGISDVTLAEAYGQNARIPLTNSSRYAFTDIWWQRGYHYKTRLRNTTTGAVSAFSDPIVGNGTCAVTPDKLVRGWLRLADIQGRPIVGRSILFSTIDTVRNVLSDGTLIDADDQQVTTDSEGYASILLLRGVPVVVAIAGAALVRNVLPPTDGTVHSFNLLDPLISRDDAFDVQHTPLVLAERIDP